MTTFQEGNETAVEIANLSKCFLRQFMRPSKVSDDFSKRFFYCQVRLHNEET